MQGGNARLGFIFPNTERQLMVGDSHGIVHKHLNYFTPSTARHVFEICGFSVLSSWSKGDSFFIIAKPGSRIPQDFGSVVEKLDEKPGQTVLKIKEQFTK
jgi:hypothetical protein